MKKFKKILLMGVSYVLIAALAIGGTLAYLKDDDSAVNVMTLGNVYIEQIEQERDENGKLVPFKQGKPALPAVYEGTSIPWADENDWIVPGNEAWKVVEDNVNVVDKFVSVKNVGKSDAYVRTIIAFEAGKDEIGEPYMHLIHNDSSDTWEFDWAVDENKEDITIEIDGSVYYIGVYTYTKVLEPGVTTVPNVKQIYLDKTATNEVCASYGETFEIIALSQAVQAAGFADAATALNAGFGEIDAANVAKWFDGAVVSTSASSDSEFEDALTSDERTIVVSLKGDVTYDVAAWANDAMGGEKTENIIINGNGYTITFNQTNSDWNNIVTNGAKLIINNAKITNAGHNNGPWNRHDLNFACEVELNNVVSDKALAFKAGATLNNVTINDANTSDTYAIWIQPKGQTVTLNNVTIDMLDCTDGRGIKIDDQYLAEGEVEKVTLNVSNTTFKTEEKSAILVKTPAGAEINISNIDILGVAADPINAVWVDEASAAYADLVVVNGANKIVEGNQLDPSKIVIIKTAEELFAFANDVNVNGNKYSGKTVILGADIDLQNKPWTPIGQTGATEFRGTFDGLNHTIKNLYIDNSAYTDEHTSTGLFGWAESGVTIKNVKVDGAKVTGNHNVAVIVGYTYSGKIINCHVSKATVVCNHANGDACGDKAGTIAGYTADEAVLSGCTASDSTVTAGRDAGQLFGLAYTKSVSGCSATNVVVSATGNCNRPANINNAVIGRVDAK